MDRKVTTPYLLKNKNDNTMAVIVNKQGNTKRGQTNMVAKRNAFKYEEHNKCLDPYGKVRSPMNLDELGNLTKSRIHIMGCIISDHDHYQVD